MLEGMICECNGKFDELIRQAQPEPAPQQPYEVSAFSLEIGDEKQMSSDFFKFKTIREQTLATLQKFHWIIEFFKTHYQDSPDIQEYQHMFNLMMKDPGPVFMKAQNLSAFSQLEKDTNHVNLMLFQLVRERNYPELIDKLIASLVIADEYQNTIT